MFGVMRLNVPLNYLMRYNTKDQRPGEYQPTLLLPNADWVLECRWCCENTGAPNKEK